MNSARGGGRELLADRKALLLARSSLYRLSLAREGELLRESLRWRNLASSARHSGALRPLVFGALLLMAGRSRLARVLGVAARIIAIMKTVQALRGAARRKAP
ncbi:MAG TPA: hypothetical protein VF386_12330 [Usitatibacter sp.]